MPPRGPADVDPRFSDEVLRGVVKEDLGLGADAEVDDVVRFQRSVVKCVRRRMGRFGANAESHPAVFFLTSPPAALPREKCGEAPMLDNGRSTLGGRLWFVGPMCASGVYLELEEWEDAAVFEHAVNSLDMTGVPAVIMDPRDGTLELRWYPLGLDKRDRYEPMAAGGTPIGIEHIIQTITRIHGHSLCTPTALGRGRKAWVDARRYWVSDDAEYIVEACLQSSLAEAYPSCDIRKEQDMPVGRSDLEIHESHFDGAGGWTSHAVLELKVLRSLRSSGNAVPATTMKAQVKDGVLQAYQYRDYRKARAAALCCFDMRRNRSDCFVGVRRLAKTHDVRLATWTMYNAPKTQRHAVGAPTSPAK
jgi:hypothetical protein